jgi:superfamily II DNA or RNA helicase
MTTREVLTDKILESVNTNDIFFLELPTGYGKSLISIKIQDSLIKTEVIPYTNGENSRSVLINYPKTLILIAEKAHKLNWEEEYRKQGYEDLLHNTTFACYASLHKIRNTSWDLVVCDEAHHLSADRLMSLQTLRSQKTVLLSATLKIKIKVILEWAFRDKRKAFFKETVDNAISQNILPEPKIFIHQLKLDDNIRNQQIIIDRKKNLISVVTCIYSERWKYLKNNTFSRIVIMCTQQEKYNYLSEQVEYWKNMFMRNSGNLAFKNKWMRAALDRKVYLGELKTKYFEEIDIPHSHRFIVFCASIKQAEKLGTENNIVHSKKKNVESIIKEFQDKRLNALFCVNMLREGMNLTDIDTGIIVQLDGTELPFIQKLGRIMRSDSPNVHIIYYKYTRDAEYLENILKEIDRKYIKIIRPCVK